MYIYDSVCLCKYEKNDSNETRDRRQGKEILGIFFIIRHAHYSWSSVVLFESIFGLVVNIYCEF